MLYFVCMVQYNVGGWVIQDIVVAIFGGVASPSPNRFDSCVGALKIDFIYVLILCSRAVFCNRRIVCRTRDTVKG